VVGPHLEAAAIRGLRLGVTRLIQQQVAQLKMPLRLARLDLERLTPAGDRLGGALIRVAQLGQREPNPCRARLGAQQAAINLLRPAKLACLMQLQGLLERLGRLGHGRTPAAGGGHNCSI